MLFLSEGVSNRLAGRPAGRGMDGWMSLAAGPVPWNRVAGLGTSELHVDTYVYVCLPIILWEYYSSQTPNTLETCFETEKKGERRRERRGSCYFGWVEYQNGSNTSGSVARKPRLDPVISLCGWIRK